MTICFIAPHKPLKTAWKGLKEEDVLKLTRRSIILAGDRKPRIITLLEVSLNKITS